MNKFFLFFFFLILLSSCYFGGTSGISSRSNLSSLGEEFAPSDSEYFYIDLDENRYRIAGNLAPSYEISTTKEYDYAEERDSRSNCEIPYILPEDEEDELTKVPSEDNLICILDIMEYELMLNDLHIVYNFPEGMCHQVRTALPWHFNHPILQGPDVIICKYVESDGQGKPQTEDRVCDRHNSDCVPGGEVSDPNVCVEDEEDLCEGEVKCCSGGKRESEDSDDSEWEPEPECFGGAARIATKGGPVDPEKGFYKRLIEKSPEGGLKGIITLPYILSVAGLKDTSASFLHANYLKDLDRFPEDLREVERDNLPDFLRASDYYPYLPRLFFTFECLDSAGEVLHQILLMVREWNTLEEFKKFYEDGGNDEADPDVEGQEGDVCDYEDREIIDAEYARCNDLYDIDDLANYEQFEIDSLIYPRIKYEDIGESE